MKQVINKWNNNIYIVIEDKGDKVILQRTNDYVDYKEGSAFEISKAEFNFNYREVKND